ncbi:MAG TPA: ABC transporter ATP-binding protein, partial [Bacteroidetes bacterium]|nr:ABC transporter ATP-binding protein [Bacteroidota bacterium]
SVNKKQILDILKRFKTDKNLSVLYISHDINSVKYIADEVFLMSNGELKSVDIKNLSEGINQEEIYRNESSKQQSDECILELKGVQKSFKKNGLLSLFKDKKGNTALDDISFRLGNNQVLGIIGESGSGKTTIARILTGLETYDKGKYFLDGHNKNLNDNKSIKEIRQNIQMVFQNPVNSLNYLVKNRTLIKEAFEVMSGELGSIDLDTEISKLFKELNLDMDILDRYPGQISGGEAQRLAIARVLVLNPKVVIFDEAFSSLDQQTKSIIYKKLFQLQKEYKISFIFITHDINSIRSVCDYMIVMHNGKIVDQGEPDQIFINPKSEYTSKLINNII